MGPWPRNGRPRRPDRTDWLPRVLLRPTKPWQRGTNENTNRLLRQYLSKTGNLTAYDQQALDAIAARLNGRPRAVLGWHTPAEVLAAYRPV